MLLAILLGILAGRRPIAKLLWGQANDASAHGNSSAAVRYLNLSMLLAPSDMRMDILYMRYQYLAESGDLEGAEQDLATMIHLDPGWRRGNPYHARGFFYMGRKRWDEAIADFRASMPYTRSQGFVDYQLGKCHENKGDRESARRHYQEAEAGSDPVWSKHAREALRKLR